MCTHRRKAETGFLSSNILSKQHYSYPNSQYDLHNIRKSAESPTLPPRHDTEVMNKTLELSAI